jgi:hypothetical protein
MRPPTALTCSLSLASPRSGTTLVSSHLSDVHFTVLCLPEDMLGCCPAPASALQTLNSERGTLAVEKFCLKKMHAFLIAYSAN